MAFFGRQVLAITTAVILLMVQSLPSLALCICGKETPMSCCSSLERKATPSSTCHCNKSSDELASGTSAVPGSCAKMAGEPDESGNAGSTAMSHSGCRKIDVSPSLTSLESPAAPATPHPELADGVAIAPARVPAPTLDPRFPDRKLRGPPLALEGHLYLLHASFLL